MERRVPAARRRRRLAGRRTTTCAAAIEALPVERRPASWRSATRPAGTSRVRRGGRRAADRRRLAGRRARPVRAVAARHVRPRRAAVPRRLARRGARARTTAATPRAARPCRCCSCTARSTRTCRCEISRGFGARRAASVDRGRGPHGAPRPGLALLAGGDRVALTRDEAAALDAADPLAGFRERFVLADGERIYLDGNSLGRLPVATRDRLRALVDEWGDRLVSGWPDWIDAPTRVGDLLAGRRARRRGPARCWSATRRRSTSTSCARAALDAAAPGALVTDARQLPDRPLRARGPGRAARRSSCGSSTTSTARARRRRAGRAALARRLPDRRARRHAGADGERRARHGARVVWDLCHSAGAVPVDAARGAASSWPSAAPTSTSTPGRARPRSCTSRASCSRSCARRSGAGSASATSSRWSATTTRSTASAASSPARRRSSTSPRSRRARGSPPRPGVDAPAREGDRPVRADRRAARRLAGAARASSSARRATRRAAARTSRCATRRRGRSAAR